MWICHICFPAFLRKLVNELKPVDAQWRKLGREFGFTENDLDGIKQSNPQGDVQQWMTTMLDRKLRSTPGFGLDDVSEALRNIGCWLLDTSDAADDA